MYISESLKKSISDVLKEGIGKKTIDKIADLTDNNFHGKAIRVAAGAFGLKDHVKEIDHINNEHMRLGHLTRDLHARREAVYNSLILHSKKTLSPEQHEKFMDAF